MNEKQAINLLYSQLLNEGEQGISIEDIKQVYKLVQSLDVTLIPCQIQAKALKMIDEAREVECSFMQIYERECYERLLKQSLNI